MRVRLTIVLLGSLLAVQTVRAQQPKIDSATIARANKPILRTGEVLGVLATTGLAFAFDQKLRNTIHDPTDKFGRTASDIGNALGNGVYVYPTLLVGSLVGKAVGSQKLYGVSSRALKSTLLAGAGAIVLKTIIGRERPGVDNAFKFHPFNVKDKTNSFPSGHAMVSFALATSFAREIKGTWDDVFFYSLATLTAYARMHDDRHWMSDVVFGAGVGILSARFVHRRESKILIKPKGLGLSLDF